MHIALIFDGIVPPVGYGGIERVVYWLTKELIKQGHQVTLIADPVSTARSEFPRLQFFSYQNQNRIPAQVLENIDIFHFHNQSAPEWVKKYPYLITEHGNNKRKRSYDRNTVFLSRSHAANHGAKYFLPNGIPVEDYPFATAKNSKMVYMAKLNWRAKNARTAIQLAFDTDTPIGLTGGRLKDSRKVWGRWLLRYPFKKRLIEEYGVVDGQQKLDLLKNAMCLFYLVNWHEPFALAPHEALACGTPVLATPNGALVEYVKHGDNGYIVSNHAEAIQAIRDMKSLSPDQVAEMAERCRQSAYSIEFSVQKHLEMYERILRQRFLYSEDDAAKIRFTRPHATMIG